MKIAHLIILLLCYSFGISQSLPIDFESDVITSDFTNFDGGTATVINNPQNNGIYVSRISTPKGTRIAKLLKK